MLEEKAKQIMKKRQSGPLVGAGIVSFICGITVLLFIRDQKYNLIMPIAVIWMVLLALFLFVSYINRKNYPSIQPEYRTFNKIFYMHLPKAMAAVAFLSMLVSIFRLLNPMDNFKTGGPSNLEHAATAVVEGGVAVTLYKESKDAEIIEAYFSQADYVAYSHNTAQESALTVNKDDNKSVLYAAVVVVVVIACLFTFFATLTASKHNPQATRTPTTIKPDKPSSHVVESRSLGDTLLPEQEAAIEASGLVAFMPKGYTAQDITISIDSTSGQATMGYGINLRYGYGVTPGSYSIIVHTDQSATFNPPADCGMPGGTKSSKPIRCAFYAESDHDTPAFIYDGHAYPSVMNTSVTSYSTMYMQRNGNIISIVSADTNPGVVYDLAKNLQVTQVKALPETTQVHIF